MKTSRQSYSSECLNCQSAQVQEGRGRNVIPPPEREPLWKGFLEKFRDPLIIILLIVFFFSTGVSVYEYNQGKGVEVLIEPLGVLIALLLATGVGFIFEVRAAREFDVLNKVKDKRKVKVWRRQSGKVQRMEVSKQDVCVGDIVWLESGDEVPADGVLLEGTALRVDESNFTGEPYANKYVESSPADSTQSHSTSTSVAVEESTYPANKMLRNSIVIEGSAVMRVEAVGVDTEEGRGVMRSAEGSDVKTPLNQQLDRLGRYISLASFVIAALIVVGRILYFFLHLPDGDFDWMEFVEMLLSSIMIAVTLIVVAVPEGLPLSITLSLALSMRKMLRQKNLVRKLHACETMGATTVICTDKTGTLTQNRMRVQQAHFTTDSKPDDFVALAIAVNSTADLTRDEKTGDWHPIGNPTEGALLLWLQDNGYDYSKLRDDASVLSSLPFSTENKRMETTITLRNEGRDAEQQDGMSGQAPFAIRFIKGAPEIVMDMCSVFPQGMDKESVQAQLLDMQNHAMRTLAFAYQKEGGEVTFMGIVGIADPVREDVPEAVSICRHEAHVRVIIVTGDTSGTALEIGRQVGLIKEGDGSRYVTGVEFAAMTDEAAKALLADPDFKLVCRARPDDKARLVMLLQELGEVVAVTGDGTNDAPALSKAQVGLSMGDGTSRAKEASDITIIDNSFSSINNAIMWGRSLYLNIKRFILFQMTINVSACLIVLLGAFLGLESPLTVTQMLWVNLIMDTFAAIALSSLPADPQTLHHRPRSPKANIIDRSMAMLTLGGGGVMFAIMAYLWQRMSSDEQGTFFTIFILLQFWNIFNARYYRTNRSLLLDLFDMARCNGRWRGSFSMGFVGVLLAIFIGQILIVQFGGNMFNTTPLPIDEWLQYIGLTSLIMWVPDFWRTIKNYKL